MAAGSDRSAGRARPGRHDLGRLQADSRHDAGTIRLVWRPSRRFGSPSSVPTFPDSPFVMTLPKKSDLYGNPQVDPVTREEIPKFYADFWTKPTEINRGHTIHEYWMEQSRGKIGVAVEAFGPYRMPTKTFQYGGWQCRRTAMPAGHEPQSESDARSRCDVDGRRGRGHPEQVRPRAAAVRRLRRVSGLAGIRRDEVPDEGRHYAGIGQPRSRRSRDGPGRATSNGRAGTRRSGSGATRRSSPAKRSGAIRHEVSHAAFRIGDNYNNPYVHALPPRRLWPVGRHGSRLVQRTRRPAQAMD